MEWNFLAVNCKGPARERGSLYLETIVGMALLSFSLTAIAPLFMLATRGNASSEDMTAAAMLAADKAEELKAANYTNLAPGTYSDTVKVRRINYQRSWTIQANAPHTTIKTITVTVLPARSGPRAAKAQAVVSMYRIP